MAEFDRLARIEESLKETIRRLSRLEDKYMEIKYFDERPIQDRLARIETKIDVFWNGLSMDFARLLNRGGEPTNNDDLMHRLMETEQELQSIRNALETGRQASQETILRDEA